MKAVIIREPGGPDVLDVRHVEDPSADEGDVVINVRATALNRADLMQRQGAYPPPPGAPPYPGLECAGEVLEVGPGVTRWTVGQKVMALLGGGGYAEKVAVPQETVMPIPAGMAFDEAAAIPEAWLTAYSNMIQIGRLASGETVLIHAGASGVGSAAIQLAKGLGANIFSTVSTGKVDHVRQLGADVVIDYHKEDFADRIEEETDGRGVDLIIDFIGAPYWQKNLRVLAPWGRLVLVGLLGGNQVDLDLRLIMGKKLSIHGSTLRDRTIAQKGALVESFIREILPAFASGDLQPVLDRRRFRLDQIQEAHQYMQENRNIGKIVVAVAGR